MGAIEDVYDDLDADVPFEEFEAAVEQKVEDMGGLADEETAAMLIAHELRDEEVNSVADIEPGMDDVKFLAKVMTVGEVRTFERDGEDEDGHVLNVEVADESGRITISLWDQVAVDAKENLQAGDVLRIMGRPKEGYSGLEVAVDKVEPDPDAEVDVEAVEQYRVEDLTMGASDVDLLGVILDTDTVRTFDRDDGTEGKVSNMTVGDETGRVRVTMWDEMADRVEELAAGTTVEVVDGYVRERDGDLELHVGSRGAIEEVDEDVEYVPETTDIDDLELEDVVDIAGGVIETSEKRTFDRDDGSQGQVRNVRIKDDTGEIRVALWGDKADRDIDLADRVVFTDVEVQDGWQDDLEASAGWRSSVTVLEDAAGGTADDAAGASGRDAGQGGLDSFESTGSSADSSSESTAAATAEADGDEATGADASDDGGVVEFTGTVVQAGDPIVLDDGTQTRSVETSANLRLGEEVTVRGVERDGTIDADDVF
ncbi:single-stranded DNA binding protein [Halobaculum magnesiiphilum]|uniref:Single-stranded DNA binding protein n=1 Tax=Halobaculum magnesiiphilum TaxID=1017351 RepID=A0A8T8WBI7_9EURY|nr:single-stranded DNA binding protein [Halobaculum magnesiiphilum]QZP37209.1 single-stranded DNA binding protein [Halobaculum magnesiiphilum]